MRYTMTKSFVQVIGNIWLPPVTAAMEYDLDSYAVSNIEGYRRELNLDWRGAIAHWVSLNTGDFQNVADWRADIETSEGNVTLEWRNPESELTYNDYMFPPEDD